MHDTKGFAVTQKTPVSQPPKSAAPSQPLHIDPYFCPEGADPFSTVQWEARTAQIKDENGKVLFEQQNCQIPAQWSALATNVVVSKYFYGEPNTSERESSVRQVIHRVARTIADWGIEEGYFASTDDGENFYRELAWLCLHQHGSFNSPVWFNVGLFHQHGVQGSQGNYRFNPTTKVVERPEFSYEFPQGSACFIQSVDDSMEDIMRLATSEAMLFKFGSGTGTDLSTIRSSKEKLSGGGTPSGPLSFMRVYDQIAAVVKSGGKTRRAAKMQSIKDWHPDVLEFIQCKAKEEKKAHTLIASGEYDANFNGEAYSSIMFQNANLSVRVSDEFMRAVEADADWTTHWVTDPNHPGPTYKARDLMREIAQGTWQCGDPGLQYDSTINTWHTCKNSGRINASNPCVTGDTLVATAEGYRRIVDLVGQSVEVINGRGERSPVDRIFKTGHKPVFELRTQSGYRLKLTADHRVETANRGDVPAVELTVDDVVTLRGSGFGNDWVAHGFGELLGMAVGDGCLTHQPNQDFLFISLGEQERDVADRMQANFTEAKTWLQLADGRAHRPTSVVTTATGLRIGTSVSRLIEEFDRYAVLDAGSHRKRFRDGIFALDRPSLAAILRGLFTSDGTVANYGSKSQYVALDSTSRELLQQVQVLLLAFGIKSKLYENRRAVGQNLAVLPDGQGGQKEYPVEQMHSLRISRSSRVLFEREIGFVEESVKARKLRELNANVSVYQDVLQDRVASLTPCGEEDVFDLTEPVTSHFVANGIVVHNCSEYMFLDDTACNLASINLKKMMREDGTFDVERFRRACMIFITAQEIIVDHASYPTPAIAENSHLYRPLGLGYANLGSMLMSMGIPYDSDAGRGIAGAITALLNGQAYLTSSRIAGYMGPFAGYRENEQPMLDVMQMHRDAVEQIHPECPAELRSAAREVWNECLQSGRRYGYRNAQATVLAPTGTIAFMMDCDTTGIEPDIALIKYKQLAGGGMLKIINRTVPHALRTLGYDEPQIKGILEYLESAETIEGAPGLLEEHLPVFDCAFKPANGTRTIHWKAHVGMMAAAQPFLSGAISKTVNMPADSTVEDVELAYIEGWKLGLKALAIYRDGSKQSQPLATKKEGDRKAGAEGPSVPVRRRLPDTRNSVTHKFSVGGHEGYITVGLFDDGSPGELFITMAKEGSTIGGLMDVIGTETSLALQYGVPLEAMVKKFSHARFEPSGWTTNPDIPVAKSVVDYIFRWLGIAFISGYREANTPNREGGGENPKSPSSQEVKGAAAKAEKGPGTGGQGSGNGTKGHGSNGHGSNGNGSNGHGANGVNRIADVPHKNGNGQGPGVRGQGSGAAVRESRSTSIEHLTLDIVHTTQHATRDEQFASFQSDAPACDGCGAITVRNGNCYLCHNCGQSMGCS